MSVGTQLPLWYIGYAASELVHVGSSMRSQCEMFGLARSSFYDQSARESKKKLALMRRIDEQQRVNLFVLRGKCSLSGRARPMSGFEGR